MPMVGQAPASRPCGPISRITMRQKEAPFFVKQQVVQVGFELLILQSQFGLDESHHAPHGHSPIGIRQRKLIRREPPHAPHAGIDERRFPLAIRSLLASPNQLLRLDRTQRQTHRSQSVHFQSRQHQRHVTARTIRSRPVDLAHGLIQFLRDHQCRPLGPSHAAVLKISPGESPVTSAPE